MARRPTTEAKLKRRMVLLLGEARRVGLRFALQVGLPVRPNKRQSITASAVLLEDVVAGSATGSCPCCSSPVDIERMHRSRVYPYVLGWCVACLDSAREIGIERTVAAKKKLRRDAGNEGRAARIETARACARMFAERGIPVVVGECGVVTSKQWEGAAAPKEQYNG